MDSKEALEKLLKENEDARERFKKIGNLSEEEAGNELRRFENEFGIELKKEDFAGQKLDSEQLEGVTGGILQNKKRGDSAFDILAGGLPGET